MTLRHVIQITLDMKTGRVEASGRVDADPRTATAIINDGGWDSLKLMCNTLVEILSEAARMVYAIQDNSVRDDLNTENLEEAVIASGTLDKIMNRIGIVGTYLHNGDIAGALVADPGVFLSTIQNLSATEETSETEPPYEEMARRRAIVLRHPDGGA